MDIPGKLWPVCIIPDLADDEKLLSMSLTNEVGHAFTNDLLIFVIRCTIYEPVTL